MIKAFAQWTGMITSSYIYGDDLFSGRNRHTKTAFISGTGALHDSSVLIRMQFITPRINPMMPIQIPLEILYFSVSS